MNGIVKYNREKLNKRFLSTNETEYSTRQQPSSWLLNQNTSKHTILRPSNSEQYFEIHFLRNSFVYLTGYGFLSATNNYAVPRNWNVSCVSKKPRVILADAVNNKTLCPDATASKLCSPNDKKAFECKNTFIKCTNIRFSVTGLSAANSWNFALAGIELFGFFGIGSGEYCTSSQVNIFRFLWMNFFVFIAS